MKEHQDHPPEALAYAKCNHCGYPIIVFDSSVTVITIDKAEPEITPPTLSGCYPFENPTDGYSL